MSSKSEFYIALDHLMQAAKDAHKAMPESFSDREKKIWGGILGRIPEQITDVKGNLDNPHTPTYEGRMKMERNKLIIP